MEMSNWDDEEVKTLFRFVEVKKSEGVALINIFDQYAGFTKRHKNSVRNYYYKELSDLKENFDRVKRLGINLSNHIVCRGEHFSKEEEKKIIGQISELVQSGCSVRKACLTLSNGSVPLMLRLQNKYRTVMCGKEGKKDMGQIIKMPNRDKLSEDDLKALFLGLVRIVKKQECENVKMMYDNELFKANEKMKNMLLELKQKQSTIDALKRELLVIKSQFVDNLKEINGEGQGGSNSASKILNEFFGNKTGKNAVKNL